MINAINSQSLVFAMGFVSPWLLAGLLLAGIPILLHFLYKRQYRETSWAAMRFLLEAARKHSRRLRLEQLVLLAVRVLILVFIAFALAHPYAELVGAGSEYVEPTHRIVVLDSSFSMAFQENGKTRFERAQELVRDELQNARAGDLFNLARICDDSSQIVIGEPSSHIVQVTGEVNALRVTDERGDVVAALRQAAELADLLPEIPRKEILIVSDFQRDNWFPDAPGAGAEVRRLLESLASRADLHLLDVKQGASPNIAVTSLATEESVPVAGRDISFRSMLRNFGDETVSKLRVEIHVDGRVVENRDVDLPPGADVPLEFSHVFRESGEHVVEVKLADDALPLDNRRALALPVRSELNILLVNGRTAGQPVETATFYLDTVLSPTTSRESWSGSTHPRVIGDGELIQQNLSRFDCVCLSNVRMFTDREAALLRSYVESGGGLLLWLGDLVQVENYNRVLFRDGQGVLPAPLGQRVGSAKGSESAFGFDAEALEHPILSRFRGNPGTGLETTLTLEYFQIATQNLKAATVALRFQNGDPAIVESRIGQGRVIVVATAADTSWGTWPVQRSFPPLVHEMVRFAVAGRSGHRQLLVGEPILRLLPSNEAPADAQVLGPENRPTPLVVSIRDKSSAAISFAETDRSGLYQLKLGPPLNRSEKFAVNVDPRECDLSSIGVAALDVDSAEPAENLTDRNVNKPKRSAVAAVATKDLSRWLLFVALCLLFVEQLMAWRFGPGLALLLVCGAAALTWHAFVRHAVLGYVAVAVFAAGLVGLVVVLRRFASRGSPS